METKSSQAESNLNIEKLLDPDNPYVLSVVLPAAALAMLGFKRGAILWIFGAIILNIGRQFI